MGPFQMTLPQTDDARSTKERILDAAEELFAARGYHGVSLREITDLAGVERALANYHFGPKEDLFRHCVSRRAEEHSQGVLAQLAAARHDAPNGVPGVERIVAAFCRFTFERTQHGGPGWKRYFQLLSRTAITPTYETFLQPLNAPYGAVFRQYTEALQAALPSCRPEHIFAAFHYMQAVVAHLLSETGLLDRQSRGLTTAGDFEAHLPRLVRFCSAGIYALADSP